MKNAEEDFECAEKNRDRHSSGKRREPCGKCDNGKACRRAEWRNGHDNNNCDGLCACDCACCGANCACCGTDCDCGTLGDFDVCLQGESEFCGCFEPCGRCENGNKDGCGCDEAQEWCERREPCAYDACLCPCMPCEAAESIGREPCCEACQCGGYAGCKECERVDCGGRCERMLCGKLSECGCRKNSVRACGCVCAQVGNRCGAKNGCFCRDMRPFAFLFALCLYQERQQEKCCCHIDGGKF